MSKLTVLVGSVLVVCTSVQAGVSLNPTSYDMVNGQSGLWNYWDESYSGTGNTSVDGAPLSGGLGDLTDGFSPTENCSSVEAPAGPGPYVGWYLVDPIITFNFAAAHTFESINIHFDDLDGYGGVDNPSGVTINSTLYGISDPVGYAPFWANIDVTGQSLTTNTLTVQLHRAHHWVFASEVEFVGSANEVDFVVTGERSTVPAPSAFLLAGLGAGAVGWMRRRRSI